MANNCQNCKKVQSCNRDHYHACGDFELYGYMPEKPSKSKSLCRGCRNDYYNQNRTGGCWSYKPAKVVLKSAPASLSHRPPWRLDYRLDCFSKQW